MTARGLVGRLLRADAAVLAVLAVLVLLAVGLAVAAPRVQSATKDSAARERVSTADDRARTVTVQLEPPYRDFRGPVTDVEQLAATAQHLAEPMRPALRAAVGPAAYSAQSGTYGVTDLRTGARPDPQSQQRLALRVQSGYDEHVTWVKGRAPAPTAPVVADGDPLPTFEVALAADVAAALHVSTGSLLRLTPFPSEQPLAVRITGIFRPSAPDPWSWAGEPRQLVPQIVRGDTVVITGVGLVAPGTLPQLDRASARSLATAWRFPISTTHLDTDSVDAVVADIGAYGNRLRLESPAGGSYLASSGLAGVAAELHVEQSVAVALWSVALTGLLAVGVATIALVSWVLVQRREPTLTLLRARGASTAAVVLLVLWEVAVVVLPAAVVAGLLAALRVPARQLAGPVLLGAAIAALALALPAGLAWGRHRRIAGTPDRADADPAGRRRVTVELAVAVLAVGGGWLLLRGGSGAGGLQAVRAVAPTLLALLAGLLVLRLFVLPVRPLRDRARRGPGAVGLVALAGASRSAATYLLPVLVLVVAIALTTFGMCLRSTLSSAQAVNAYTGVGAAARMDQVAPEDEAAVAAVPGVCGVAAARFDPAAEATTGDGTVPTAVLLLDVDAYRAVTASTPLGAAELDPLVAAPGPTAGAPVPVLLPDGARSVPSALTIAGTAVPVVAVGTAPPSLAAGADAVVVPAAAWPGPAVGTNRLYVCGDLPTAVLRAAAPGSAVVSATERVEATRAAPLVSATLTGLSVVAVLTAGFALLTLVLARVDTRPRRARERALLRTLGFSARQGRRLEWLELLPLLAVALVAGIGAGIGVCALLLRSLDLAPFSGGRVPASLVIAPWGIAALAAGLVVLAVAAAIIESVIDRHRSLGAELRGGA